MASAHGAAASPALSPAASTAMAAIMDSSKPLDTAAFDAMCDAMESPGSPAGTTAREVLEAFRQHPDAWRRVDGILDRCRSDLARVVAAGVLEDAIMLRWETLGRPEQESVRNFISGKIIKLSSDPAEAKREEVFLTKLDVLLVGVLKQDWPHRWPSFIDEMNSSSRAMGEGVCANNMRILRLLSEEVFDLGSGVVADLTSDRRQKLQASLSSELKKIFNLIAFVAASSTSVGTLTETLRALQKYLSWVPASLVLETDLVATLTAKFLPAPAFRTITLDCLTEVVGAEGSEDARWAPRIMEMFGGVMATMARVIPPGADIPGTVRSAKARGSQAEPILVHRLTLFLSGIFRRHLRCLEGSEALRPMVLQGLAYLLGAIRVDDKDLCKLVAEFWRDFSRDLFDTAAAAVSRAGGPSAALAAFTAATGGADAAKGASADAALHGAMAAHPRVMNYSRLLSELRLVGTELMPKPEEVLVEKDASGDVVRSFTRDTDALALYDVMREMMVYLTHLDPADTDGIIVAKLSRQVDGSEWSWERLNALCWAAGSVSGTMSEEHEKRFLITVIRDLLHLVTLRPGKNNKAVVASNIMYVVGQYPRFLSSHWKFLKTVVYKLFEFMHERHEGVQDMACDTFLKLAQRCSSCFVALQPRESRTFVEELVSNVDTIIADLEPHQVQAFFEAAGCMVAAHPNMSTQESLTDALLRLPREALDAHVARAASSLDSLRSADATRDLSRIFANYERVARAVGRGFSRHAASVFLTVLSLYRTYTGFVSAGAATMGTMAVTMADGAAIQRVRRAILGFLRAFVRNNRDKAVLMEHFMPHLVKASGRADVCMVESFAGEPPLARLPEVLDVFRAAALTLKTDGTAVLSSIVPRLLRPAVELISANYDDHPDMRVALYRFTQTLSRHCAPALFAMAPADQKLYLDTLLWGIKHHNPFVAERAGLALRDFLGALAGSPGEHASAFFCAFAVTMVHDLLFVLTDRMHKAQFVVHVELLRGLFDVLANTTLIPRPIWDQASEPQAAGTTNSQYVCGRIASSLASAFPNLTREQVHRFVSGLADTSKPVAAYRTSVRDFLIESLSFNVSDSAALWRAEQAAKLASEHERKAAVPGLQKAAAQPALGMRPDAAAQAAGGDHASQLASMAVLDDMDDDDF
ncbi:hypothetical protein FNF27_03624 [Cafeteria roenbergensis]|uniref:Exportin-1 n=2 Tax=Cafeteria roenbergensis TaxID=33653 RepID=A0A5A8D9Y6_CAFRO|nr:hypothetical protein FNF29_05252 [Cafeteria roenbergensis]KAA0162045.1 hypothetical protein FNF31_03456 [Cafeteria roenbergensis]KAA0174909.1 hypothetical protein FNF27_03624 [Cafeteria roenbergensis]|eukprot:KAA0150449.1 hypothetical protein FNF29_05252 [Cafeteria roenbergensis]